MQRFHVNSLMGRNSGFLRGLLKDISRSKVLVQQEKSDGLTIQIRTLDEEINSWLSRVVEKRTQFFKAIAIAAQQAPCYCFILEGFERPIFLIFNKDKSNEKELFLTAS